MLRQVTLDLLTLAINEPDSALLLTRLGRICGHLETFPLYDTVQDKEQFQLFVYLAEQACTCDCRSECIKYLSQLLETHRSYYELTS